MLRLLCSNASGETIPAGGCFRISGVNGATARGEIRYSAIKPDGDDRFYYINGPVPVTNSKTLYAEQDFKIVRALVESGLDFGAEVGPESGTWTLQSSGTGYRVIGETGADGLTPVVAERAGSGSGSGSRIEFTVDEVICAVGGEKSLLVTWTMYTGECQSPPGVDEYTGQIEVLDRCILDSLTETQLLGATGTATYWFGRYDCTTGVWVVDDICAGPECDD